MSMDDTLRRIAPSDLGILRGVATDAAAHRAPEPQAPPQHDRGCAACNGSGFYKEAVPARHPHFGVLFPCACKLAEQDAAARAVLLKKSNIADLRSKTFANYNAFVRGVTQAANAAKAFAKEPRGWLTFAGGYGVGKTHLLAAITNELLNRKIETYLGVTPDLLDHLRATFGPTSDVRYDELFERVRNVDVLLLDDLGTESSTSWAKEKLFQIINHRYNCGLPLVVSTNVALATLEGRIESRLSDRTLGRIITIDADDYRKRDVIVPKGKSA